MGPEKADTHVNKHLLLRPESDPNTPGKLFDLPSASMGFEYLGFRVQNLDEGDGFTAETGDTELGLVVLGGRCSIQSSAGSWGNIGVRRSVFDGMPYTLYLPPAVHYRVTADTDCKLALCSCRAEEQFAARLITPREVEIEIRGGGNATRQINHILKPEFPAHRLLLVEVYTPSGNWSSYPPHKHDVHNPPEEVDLEEIYYYYIDQPEGYAIQRIYTKDGRLDVTLTPRSGDLVLIPEGYHPVVAAHGYNVYYLNALAGSARSMAASDDPDHAWTRKTWDRQDPRVPLVNERG